MQKEIDEVIKKAIDEDWYNGMTTSDLQGVCEAQAMKILKKHIHLTSSIRNTCYYQKYPTIGGAAMPTVKEIGIVSEKILQGIYKHQEARP
jgi:hypothetical protein